MWSHFLILYGRSSYNVYFYHCYFLVTKVLFTYNLHRIIAWQHWNDVTFHLLWDPMFILDQPASGSNRVVLLTHVWTQWGGYIPSESHPGQSQHNHVKIKIRKLYKEMHHSSRTYVYTGSFAKVIWNFQNFLQLPIDNKITAHVSSLATEAPVTSLYLRFQILPNKLCIF